MTNQQLKDLEDKLWDAANALRAYGGLKASDYAVPVLGLIFLKFADNKYSQFEAEITAEFEKNKGTRTEQTLPEIALATCGFYLPPKSRFDYLLNLPGDSKMAQALKAAMEGIEEHQGGNFQDILPKDAFFDIEKKKADILPQLLKAFSDIPADASGDIFGKIYEYFLGKFAMSEGQKGGEFFTPTSVVRFIVEVIEPYKGKILDPACGSGGMFVQSARFVEKSNENKLEDLYVCGQEYMGETVRLAKMNLLVNNLRGEIIETNSYGSDPYESYGKFDYVMANPPFNVKSVKESTVKNDKRFYEYGLPKNKGKKDDKISDANYLWISLFATSLNATGQAGFVMPNSASDARNAEYDIRKKIVDSGIVECMVSMPSNMFLTVTLPATLWFFNKKKLGTDRQDKILFLDARNVYNQIDRAHREWTEEQQQNLAAIVRLYRGETHRYLLLINSYLQNAHQALQAVEPLHKALKETIITAAQNMGEYAVQTKTEKRTPKQVSDFELWGISLLAFFITTPKQAEAAPEVNLTAVENINAAQLAAAKYVKYRCQQNTFDLAVLKKAVEHVTEDFKTAETLKLKNDKVWNELNLNRTDKTLETALQAYTEAVEQAAYWRDNILWLQKRFPDAVYKDITGLCKAADRTEYADEQDYSLNAGRYVGVEIEDDNITEEEFKERLSEKAEAFEDLTEDSSELEELLIKSLKHFTEW